MERMKELSKGECDCDGREQIGGGDYDGLRGNGNMLSYTVI